MDQYKFIRGKYILTMEEEQELINDGLLVVRNNFIEDIGEYESLITSYKDVEGEWLIYDNGLVMPGLVSNHTHLYQSVMKGLGSTMSLDEWVINVIYPMALAMDKDDFYDMVRFNLLEMISTGTTCFADSMYHHHNLDNIDGVADAIKDMGMRGVLVRAVQSLNFDARIPDAVAEKNIDITEGESKRCIEKYHNTANGKITVGLEALSPFDCDEETIKLLYQIAEQYDVRFQMHVAETISEQIRVESKHKMGVIEYLDKLGVLSDRTLLIHNIWVTPKEIRLIAKRRAHVSHNPVSNMILADGIAPVPELLAAGVNVGLGVDGAASNNSQDMFEVIKMSVLLHRANKLNTSIISAADALRMATIESAKTIGLDQQVGSLKIGKKADIIVVDTSSCHMGPTLDVVSNLVFSANGRDVDTVIIDGEVIMRGRKFETFNIDEIVNKGNECAHRVAKLVGIIPH